ncbi:hypothetical protein BCR32DRAFT_298489 [Anaeromyces robustus]|uniref:N-acetyltransferase domain-containing protein n=1 Tax=Anaeromyces robustus TaxID=1754192 RepID=A0A1Y1VPM5_9FUNG|nr:hypothetical protein BCR32DRAFT_298489 [Anaeromyces robustus]|eukprot:ORX63260.1 hypothetical protein BCR32DRAFT_298489 [Anaeromyces robustus]
MDFRKLVPEDQALIDEYLKNFNGFSTDFSVATILLFEEFEDVEISVGEKAIFIKGNFSEDEVFYPPLCKPEDFKESMEKIFTYYKEKDKPYIVTGITDEYINLFFKQNNIKVDEHYYNDYSIIKNDEFYVLNDRDSAEYVYLPNDLINLGGNKYRKIREKVHAFYKEFHNRYEMIPYTENEKENFFNLIKIWNEEKNHSCVNEINLLKFIFENKEKLNIEAFLLKIDKQTAGLTIIQELPNHVGVVILEKSSSKYRNANCILNLFEANQLQNCKGISRQEDIGIEGLRQAKLSYKPFHMEKKHELVQFNSKEFFNLYQSIFGDSNELIDLIQNSETYKLRFSTFVMKNQKIISIGAVREKRLRIFNEIEEIPFVFGIATKPEERKKGYAGEVIEKIINKAYIFGYNLAMIAPQEEHLIKYYEKFGFVKFNYHKKVSIENLFKKNFNIQQGSINDSEEITKLFNNYTKNYKISLHRDVFFTTERLKEVFVDGGKLFILSNNDSNTNYGYILYEDGEIIEYINLLENEPNENINIIKNILINKGYEYILDCKFINTSATMDECNIEKDTFSLLRIINPMEFMKKYSKYIYFDDENFNKNVLVKDPITEDCFFNIKKNNKEIKFSMIHDNNASDIEISISNFLQIALNRFMKNNEEYPIKDKFFCCENW